MVTLIISHGFTHLAYGEDGKSGSTTKRNKLTILYTPSKLTGARHTVKPHLPKSGLRGVV